MMRLTFAMILVFASFLLPTRGDATPKLIPVGDKQEGKIPKEVREAEQTLTKWLNGFNSQTSGEIREALGNPATETSWLFREKKEPLLKYKVGDSTTLSLYFHEGRVVKAGLSLLP
jgi:hypothetical protein